MRVCVNVDDYGYSKSQIDGTIYAFKNGVVTSTTVLCNQRDELMEYGMKRALEVPGLGIGVHLNLTHGNALTNGTTIQDHNGCFFHKSIICFETMDRKEIYEEWKAQIERFIVYFNRKPTHLDGHIHKYSLMEKNNIKDIVKQLAKEYGVECRGTNQRFVFYGDNLYDNFTIESYEQVVKDALEKKYEGIEIMSHPGFVDEELYEKTSYASQRIQELETLCSPQVKEMYRKYHLEKVHY